MIKKWKLQSKVNDLFPGEVQAIIADMIRDYLIE